MHEGYTEVFAWGSDHFGQLGLGNKHAGKTYASPRFCSFNILIREISCGEEHSAFIAHSGHVYSMGSNSDGRLGLGDRSIRQSASPCLVEGLLSTRCVRISCGWGHTAVVTDEGSVFTWGVGEFGALGTSSCENAWSPAKVLIPKSMRGLDVDCGSRHTGVVVSQDSSRLLLMAGSGEAGQLGTGRREKEFSFVIINLTDDVQSVSCGVFHSLLLGVSGKVYAMGGNSAGQLGLGNKKSSCRPERVQIDAYIVKVACGSHSAAISDKGQLFVWGTGVFGEYLQPTRVPVTNCRDVSIGGNYGIAVDVTGSVFAWGGNSNGELGTGDFEARIAPVVVPALKGKTTKKVCCGGSYVLALGSDLLNEYRVDSSLMGENQNGYRRETIVRKVEEIVNHNYEESKYTEGRERARNSSAEVERNRFSDIEYRLREEKSRHKEVDLALRDKEIERINVNYNQLASRYEDLKIEHARLTERYSQLKIDNSRLEREASELRKALDANGKDLQSSNSQIKLSLEDCQRQNSSLMLELKRTREESFRYKNLIEEMKHSTRIETSQKIDELSISLQQKHLNEIHELKQAIEQESSKRRQAEKSLEASSKRIYSLEDALNRSNNEASGFKSTINNAFDDFERAKSSLEFELDAYYKENSDLKKRIESLTIEKDRISESRAIELSNLKNECEVLQSKIERIVIEKEKSSSLIKSESDRHSTELLEYRRKIDQLTLEKEQTVKSLQSEISTLAHELDSLREQMSRLASEKQQISNLLARKGVEVKNIDSDLASLQSELAFMKQQNDELSYQVSKLQQSGCESLHSIDKLANEIEEWEENYRVLFNENCLLKESITELESKNRQLFDNLEKELAQRAKEYKERTITMLSTPNRSTSPYLRPTTPMMHSRDKSEDIGNTAAKLLEVIDSPKSVRNSQYLTVPNVLKGSTTPTKEDVRIRIASLMKNRSRIEEQLQGLN